MMCDPGQFFQLGYLQKRTTTLQISVGSITPNLLSLIDGFAFKARALAHDNPRDIRSTAVRMERYS